VKPGCEGGALNKSIVVHASRAPYIVFGVMLGGIGVLCLFCAWLLIDGSFLKPGATFIAGYGIVVLWLRSFEVKLDDAGVAAGSIFGKRSLQWEEIDRAEMRLSYRPTYEHDEPGHAFRAPFRLVILAKSTSGKNPVIINIKLLSRTDFQTLVERLEASLAGCKVSVPSWMAPAVRD